MKKRISILAAISIIASMLSAFCAYADSEAAAGNPTAAISDSDAEESGENTPSNSYEDFTGITFEDIFYIYDGTEKTINITGELPEGAVVAYTNNSAVNAGTYEASAVITAEGYNDLALHATMKIGYIVHEKELPLDGYEIGAQCDDCFTFAQGVYKEIWGTDDGESLLRELNGETLAITAANTRNFILSAELGADVRVGDGEGTNEHSLILVQKDENGFTAYHGNVNGVVAVTYYTYDDFAQAYADKYFEGITYPNAAAYSKAPQLITVSELPEKTYGDEAFSLAAVPDTASNLSNFTYESDNTDVAEVDEEGTITIKAAGETNITVREAGNDEYAAFEKTQKLVVNRKAVTVEAINLDEKTAVLEGVLEADTGVELDFDKVQLEILEELDDGTVRVSASNIALKGEKAENYTIAEAVESTMSKENIISVDAAADNGTVTGAGNYIKGSSVALTAAPDSGYNFSGWYIDDKPVCTDLTYTFTADVNTEITAKFSKQVKKGGGSLSSASTVYTISFEPNGGSRVESIKVNANTVIREPSAPVKDGFKFAGWYTDSRLTAAYDFTSKVTKSFTLYAKWEENTDDNNKNQIILTIGKTSAMVFGEVKTNDVAPVIRNDRTMLPARFVAENLGAEVDWDSAGVVTVVKDDVEIIITIGAGTAIVNGEEETLDSPAFIENDRTYTPIRFISEKLGSSVEWNENDRTITITK